MKIRSDFVANSSSSSYLIAVNFKNYDFDEFVKTVCKNCNAEGSPYHDARLDQKNSAILRYYLRFYQRLYIGSVVKGRKSTDWKRGYDYGGNYVGDARYRYTPFQMVVDQFVNENTVTRENTKAWLVDKDTVRIEEDEIVDDAFTVPNQKMRLIRRDLGDRKDRVKNIMDFIDMASGDKDLWLSPFCANTYAVTADTIANTRDMLAEGVRMMFDKNEDLDALEARLETGDSIIFMECGDSGEGEDDTRIFSETGQFPFENVPAEIIVSD